MVQVQVVQQQVVHSRFRSVEGAEDGQIVQLCTLHDQGSIAYPFDDAAAQHSDTLCEQMHSRIGCHQASFSLAHFHLLPMHLPCQERRANVRNNVRAQTQHLMNNTSLLQP